MSGITIDGAEITLIVSPPQEHLGQLWRFSTVL